MSPDDQRTQKAAVLLECQEVEDQLSALEVRAARLGKVFWDFGSLLQREAYMVMKHDQSHWNTNAVPLSTEIITTLREWEKPFELGENIRKAKHRLQQLREQKARLGLR
jgi:hypothetical protein